MCRQRRVCRQSRRRPQRPRSPSPSRTCAESDWPSTLSSRQLGSRVGKFELGARLEEDDQGGPIRRVQSGKCRMSYLCQRGVAQALVAEINCAPAPMWLHGRESSYMPDMARNRAFRIGRSRTGLGLFATAPIKKRALIVEYKGRKLTTEQADKLEARGNRYLFEINSRWTIDGTSRKNLGRYANHSCRPNAEIHTIGHMSHTSHQEHQNRRRDYLQLRPRLSHQCHHAAWLQMRQVPEETSRCAREGTRQKPKSP